MCEKVFSYYLPDIQNCSTQRNERTIIQILLQMDIHPKLSEMQASILLDSMRSLLLHTIHLIDSLKQVITASLEELISTVPLDRALLQRIYVYFHPKPNEMDYRVCSNS